MYFPCFSSMERGLSSLAGSGERHYVDYSKWSGVRFWQDPWVPGMGSLSNCSLIDIQGLDWHNTVAAFSDQGHWNWPLLQQCLPPTVCTVIAQIRPLSAGPDDYPVWSHSTDGSFSSNQHMMFSFMSWTESSLPSLLMFSGKFELLLELIIFFGRWPINAL